MSHTIGKSGTGIGKSGTGIGKSGTGVGKSGTGMAESAPFRFRLNLGYVALALLIGMIPMATLANQLQVSEHEGVVTVSLHDQGKLVAGRIAVEVGHSGYALVPLAEVDLNVAQSGQYGLNSHGSGSGEKSHGSGSAGNSHGSGSGQKGAESGSGANSHGSGSGEASHGEAAEWGVAEVVFDVSGVNVIVHKRTNRGTVEHLLAFSPAFDSRSGSTIDNLQIVTP